jgi:hypothetical protein
MKIGLLVGRENTFPPAFIERVNAKGEGEIIAEFCKLGGTAATVQPEYRLIIDRISHEVPYYRVYLKAVALRGSLVINDPFWWMSDDKFFDCALATELGVAVPRTVALPNKSYVDDVIDATLRNLIYPLDWQGIADYVGMPAFLKPAYGGGWKHVYKVHSVEELIWAYDQTGPLQMIVQESIEYEGYVRCICIGDQVRPIRYEPREPHERRYKIDENYLGAELRARVIHDAQLLNRALGYVVNTVEFAIRDGIPYAIDFLNPAPDFDRYSITEYYFEWVVETLANFAIECACSGNTLGQGYPWYALTTAARAQIHPSPLPTSLQTLQGR